MPRKERTWKVSPAQGLGTDLLEVWLWPNGWRHTSAPCAALVCGWSEAVGGGWSARNLELGLGAGNLLPGSGELRGQATLDVVHASPW